MIYDPYAEVLQLHLAGHKVIRQEGNKYLIDDKYLVDTDRMMIQKGKDEYRYRKRSLYTKLRLIQSADTPVYALRYYLGSLCAETIIQNKPYAILSSEKKRREQSGQYRNGKLVIERIH